MTTKVLVKNDDASRESIRVKQVSVGGDTELAYSDGVLPPGESTELYVHSGARLIVEEIPLDGAETGAEEENDDNG